MIAERSGTGGSGRRAGWASFAGHCRDLVGARVELSVGAQARARGGVTSGLRA